MASKIRTLTFAALFAALIAVCAQLTVPMPSGVGFTLQTFAVALCGYLLGVKAGAAALLVYLLVGLAGAPVFSGFQGGLHVLFGPTGGFLLGFLPMAALCGLAAGRKGALRWFWGLPGLLLCHLGGVVQFALLREMELLPAFALVSAPFLVKDLLSLAAAALLAWRLGPVLARYGIPPRRERRERAACCTDGEA